MASRNQIAARVTLGLLLVAAAAAGGWVALRGWPWGGPGGPEGPLRDRAAASGIAFQMNFLPGEQGETFKINLYDHGCGLAVGDIDGDGHDDVYFCNQLGPNALYRNNGDGTFADVTARAGVALGDRVSVAATFADYDNDGDQDLFVTSTRGGNVLFRNDGDGTFTDVTEQAGLRLIAHSQTATFFDFDNDGHLDLFLTNTAAWTTNALIDRKTLRYVGKGQDGLLQVVHSPKEANRLYRNNGDGTFTDVTAKAGFKLHGWAGDAVAFDYDGDGRLDVFITSMFGRAQLYRNQGDGTFADVTLQVLGRTPWGGVGARAFGAHNNGRLDLFVADMHSDMWMGPDFKHASLSQARQYEKRKFDYYSGPNAEKSPNLIRDEIQLGREIGYSHDEVIFGNGFYRNDGGGKFTEVSDKAGLETFWPWGAAAGDFDNDGHEDLFIPTGMGYPFYYWPNYLMMNNGDGTFTNRAAEMGVEPPVDGTVLPETIRGRPAVRSSRCAVTADFDGDGRLDLMVNNFNDRPYYFRNAAPARGWVAFRLRGTKSNRDAIGAVVRLYRGQSVLTRQVHAASGYLSHSSKTVHFGLGDGAAIDRVEVTWPSGLRQVIAAPELNRRHEVVEGGGK